MRTIAHVRKALIVVGLGAVAITWVASTRVRAAPVPPPQTALMLNCDTCSGQVSIAGFKQIGPYATEAAATAAANDGSAVGVAAQQAVAGMNVHCRPCPVHPEIHVCFPILHYNIAAGGEWWVVLDDTDGKYYVWYSIPDGSKAWVCCEPHCD